jgi:membrane-anchored glycerophosphoryl diester phosphodiesterase (GDPDase)
VLMLAPAVIFMGRWLAAAPSLLVEELGPVTALQRSWALTKGRMWRGILYVVLLTLFSSIVIGLPVGLTQWVAMMLAPSQVALILIFSTVASYILNLFYQPFYATGTVLFYYDLRVRAEAYDVALRVAALEAEVAPDAPPA